MDTIISILPIILGVFTGLIVLCVIGSALLGLRYSWKRTLIKLGRTIISILLAFGATKLITAFVPIGDLLASLVGNMLGSQLEELAATAPTLYALICNFPIAIVAPLIFLVLFFVFDLLLLIPAIFVRKAVLKSEIEAAKDAKLAKKELNLLLKQKKLAAKTAKAAPSAAPAAQPAEVPAPELTAEAPTEENAEPAADAPTEENAEPAIDAPAEEIAAKPVAEPVDREAELRATIKAGKIRWGSRGISAGIKVVNAFIFIALLIMPTACLLTTLGEGVISIRDDMVASGVSLEMQEGEGALIEGDLMEDVLNPVCDDVIAPIIKNPVIVVSANPLYRAMYRNLTQVNVGGTECYLDQELADIFTLAGGATSLLVDPAEYGDVQKESFSTVIDYVANSEFRSTIAAELFAAVGNAWENNEAFFGIEKPSDPQMTIITDPLFSILANSDAESVEQDLHTFSRIVGILIDYDMIAKVIDAAESEDTMDIVNSIADDEFLAEILIEVYANEDYRSMTQPVIRFMFNSLLTMIGSNPLTEAPEIAPDLTDEQIREEAKIICAIIISGVDFIDSMPDSAEGSGGLDLIASINAGALGKFYDDSQHSLLLKDGFHDIFVSFLSADMFGDMRGVCDILIDHINNDPELNLEHLLSATQELASIFVKYQGENSSTDMVALTKTLDSLVNKVDPHTAEIIKEMIDKDAFGMDMLGGGNSTQVTKLLSSVIDTMAGMENLTAEELEKEAKALDYMMKIVNTSSSSSGGSGDSGSSAGSIFAAEEDNAEEMMDTMLNSKIATSAINSVAYETDENGELVKDDNGKLVLTEDAREIAESATDEDKEDILNSAESYYKENAGSMTAEEKETLQNNMSAIASIFGSDLTEKYAAWDAEING